MAEKGLKKVDISLAECCNEPLKFKDLPGCLDYPVQGIHCTKCETIYEKRKDGKVMYVHEKGVNKLYCGTCGSDIISAQVAHPIHDGPFPLSGSGRCNYETVPYCPKCEGEPSFHGSFIKK